MSAAPADVNAGFQTFYLGSEDDRGMRRFCLYHPAAGSAEHGPRACVVYVHPFAEEMNKARRMAALQARALARAGFAVLQVDLRGCGDSDGDFGDADWRDWVDDVVRAAGWLRERHAAPLWLWGLRAGCLVAREAADRLVPTPGFLFWQPPAAGRPLLQQFLRLATAAQWLAGERRPPPGEASPKDRLAAGEPVEIAGYALTPALARGLELARLSPPKTPCRALWFETSTGDDGALAPVTRSAYEAWQAAGCDVQATVVTGPAFWQTTEVEDAPDLVEATLRALVADTPPRPEAT